MVIPSWIVCPNLSEVTDTYQQTDVNEEALHDYELRVIYKIKCDAMLKE